MRQSALGGILAIVLVACGPPAGRLFQTTLVYPDGSHPLPVTLGDRTDLVVGIEPAARQPSAGVDPSVRSDPADSAVLIVSWLGGGCEDEAVVAFWPDDDGYWLTVASRDRPGLGGGCPAIGLPRALRIKTSEPVALDLISVTDGL
jgi:hypothetical protein